MITKTVETTVHGRVLFEERDGRRLLVGFHGYGETAEVSFEQLLTIPGSEHWSLAAIQALHPFYTRSGSVVASWMTSLDREQAAADNIAWVQRVLGTLAGQEKVVFLGFSQGAAMAARAAAKSGRCDGVILLGGDIPPELKQDSSTLFPPVLLARGNADEWYTEEKFNNDLRYLESTTRVTSCVFAGGHEWSGAFREAAGNFLRSIAG
jgi:predicted esterase